jgi:hypothetical protein
MSLLWPPVSAESQRLTVSGEVIAEATGAPPRVLVHLRDLSGMQIREVMADAGGHFTIGNVPGGRFSISATSPGHVCLPHGASYLGGLEVPVAVHETDVLNVRLKLVRTRSISGVVRDRFGMPISSIRVMARPWILSAGVRGAGPADGRSAARTDSVGRYRLEDLPPGDYAVSVLPAPQPAASEIYPETFYPSTTVPTEARVVSTAGGTDADGVDIDMRLVHASAVSGRLVLPAGTKSSRTIVWARDKNRPGGTPVAAVVNGDTFKFTSLTPSQYTIDVRATDAAAPAPDWAYWGSLEVATNSADLEGLTIALSPTVTVRAVVNFEGPAAAPNPTLLHLLVAGQQILRDIPTGSVGPRGETAFTGVSPAEYWLAAELSPEWVLASLLDETGHNLIHRPIPVPDTMHGALFTATYSSAAPRLEGALLNAAGQATSDGAVVVFAEDPAGWVAQQPSVHAARPDTTGHFVFSNLVPGPYFVAEFDDRTESQWKDPAFLGRLARDASRILVPQNGVVQHDVRQVR